MYSGPPSTRVSVDLGDNVLEHPRCVQCRRYIPEDKINGGTKRIAMYCSKLCVNRASAARLKAKASA